MLRTTTACTFSTSQLPKVVRQWCVLYILTSKCASRHNGVQLFISPLARWLRTRRFSEPTFRPPGATNHWKNTVNRDFPTFSLLITLFSSDLSLLSASALLCFSSVHIVGSLTSKLPSIIINCYYYCYYYYYYYYCYYYYFKSHTRAHTRTHAPVSFLYLSPPLISLGLLKITATSHFENLLQKNVDTLKSVDVSCSTLSFSPVKHSSHQQWTGHALCDIEFDHSILQVSQMEVSYNGGTHFPIHFSQIFHNNPDPSRSRGWVSIPIVNSWNPILKLFLESVWILYHVPSGQGQNMSFWQY